MRVLVVDDDPDILRLMSTSLRAMGHEPVACNGGVSALAKSLGDFDLALCDLSLPDVHGTEIIRAIKMLAPDLPVIVMSALDPVEWRQKSADAGADHFLQKPIRLDDLRHEVRMAELARSTLSVALQDGDPEFRQHLAGVFRRNGCDVRIVESPLQIPEVPGVELAILSGDADGAEAIVRWAGKNNVHCFVLADRNKPFDDQLLRLGASLVVNKPVEPDALVIQARFLSRRR